MDLAILVNPDRSLSNRQSHHIPYQHTPRSSQDYDIVGSAKMVLRENSYGYKPSSQKSQQNTPQTPPTPPVEEPRCILPSISNLIARAEGQPATTPDRTHPTSLPPSSLAEIATGGRTSQSQHSPTAHQAYIPRQEQHRPSGLPGRIESPRADLPPTPPLRQDAHFDRPRESRPYEHGTIHSVPSMTSLSSISALNNTDEHAQRQPLSPHMSTRHPVPSSHQSSPAGNWSAYYGSPNSVVQTPGGLYSQRPLPQTFPPSMSPINIIPAAPASGPSETVNQWQHHHYISPSSQASFPPNQDRYSCATCNKAFSRPSSLRIHSHSHTGEKPYKCPHRGCGKAFSVRSNMKRHERGCHPSSPPS